MVGTTPGDAHDGDAPAGTQLRRDLEGAGLRSHEVPCSVAVSDEQIVCLVSAADVLRQRYRSTGAGAGRTERLARLDWAVRAGRLALSERAASPHGQVRPGSDRRGAA